MAIYRVERPWGPGMTLEDIRPVALRAMLCLPKYPEITWVRTYYDAKARHSTCYYETERPDLIWEHATASMMPCESVALVEEFTPANFE